MLLVKTNNRISLFGSSSDYPSWIEKHGGISLNFTINKSSYITLKKLPEFFEFKSKISYSEIECVKHHSDIQHKVIRNALEYMGIEEGIDLCHLADIFSKSGLGSSSTFAVALMHALSVWRGLYWSKQKLAKETSYLEQVLCKETIGFQDTLAASYGSCNKFIYHTSGDISVYPICMSKEFEQEFEKWSMLFFTGIQREAHSIAKQYVPNLLMMENIQKRMMELAHIGYDALLEEDLPKVMSTLDSTWAEKKKISDSISNPQIDKYYHIVKEGGGSGKILGAGGGGSLFVMAPPDRHYEIKQSLGLVEIPFKISHEGSKVLFYEPS